MMSRGFVQHRRMQLLRREALDVRHNYDNALHPCVGPYRNRSYTQMAFV